MQITYTPVAGLQFGDEGKGKIAQNMALSGDYDVSARWGGGPNAGHTMYHNGKKVVTRHVPAGILAGIKINLIGPGCIIDPVVLMEEIITLNLLGLDTSTIYISELAHFITPYERMIDKMMNKKIGTTGKGIGPTYANIKHRISPMVRDYSGFTHMGNEFAHELKSYSKELSYLYPKNWLDVPKKEIDEWLQAMDFLETPVAPANFLHRDGLAGRRIGKNTLRILAEGAQAVMLDPTYGTYPYVTSSPCTVSSVKDGLGLSGYARTEKVVGVFKAYSTRVGEGPFPTEIFGGVADAIREAGQEYGSATGRNRRPGWLDIPQLRYSCEVNGITELIMTKTDILSPSVIEEVLVCVRYDRKGIPVYKSFKPFNTAGLRSDKDITGSLSDYISLIEASIGIPVSTISNGPNADDLVSTRPVHVH